MTMDIETMAGTTALITGIAGFTGLHLARLLLSKGLKVIGIDRAGVSSPIKGIADVRLIHIDLLDREAVAHVIAETRPALIFHLAGLIRSSDLAALLSLNVQATEHVLAAAEALVPLPRVFIAGSAAEYGLIDPTMLPVDEEMIPRPITYYGVSKLAQTALSIARYFEVGLPVYVGRLFNVVGPGEPDSAFCGAMARQVAAIGLGLQEPVLRTGNLTSMRDFLDIRDAVSAYWAIMTRGSPGRIYNVCSGIPLALTDVPPLLLDLADISARLVTEPARVQRTDVPCSYGNSSRLRSETGWIPRYMLAVSLADLLADWRNRLLEAQK